MLHPFLSCLYNRLKRVSSISEEERRMRRYISIAALSLAVIAPLGAQTPKGWKLRADRSTSAVDPDAAGAIKFSAMGTGFHAVTPQAAVFWNPANTVTG